MRLFKAFLALIGLLLIAYGAYQAYVLSNQPLAVLSVNGAEVEVLPSGNALSILSAEPVKGVRLRLTNASSIEVGGRPVHAANGTITVSGRGVVPVVINGEEVKLLFDSEGRFLALSTTSGYQLSGSEVSSDFSKAFLTYTVAPFVSGLAFTFGSLAIAEENRRIRRR